MKYNQFDRECPYKEEWLFKDDKIHHETWFKKNIRRLKEYGKKNKGVNKIKDL